MIPVRACVVSCLRLCHALPGIGKVVMNGDPFLFSRARPRYCFSSLTLSSLPSSYHQRQAAGFLVVFWSFTALLRKAGSRALDNFTSYSPFSGCMINLDLQPNVPFLLPFSRLCATLRWTDCSPTRPKSGNFDQSRNSNQAKVTKESAYCTCVNQWEQIREGLQSFSYSSNHGSSCGKPPNTVPPVDG